MVVSRTHVPVSLPKPITSLIGREQELAVLFDLLRSDCSLVAITGFGGIGKTRLALQAALELEPWFEAGAIFVSLAAITSGDDIPRAIAATANLDDAVDTASALAAALGLSPRLLVLDNLEQIPDAAPTILTLLHEMPQVTILATSRTQLEIGGEHVLSLEPLPTEGPDSRSLAAVQMFIERSRAIAPSMPTDDEAIAIIDQICQRLEGIPLAIELAAGRLSIFTLSELLVQLDQQLPVLASKRVDLPDRQKTMRNAITWTYELLDPNERRLFTWLSVYEPDISLDSIRHVARQLELTEDPLDLVQFLVARSLIRPVRVTTEIPRYQMLQMLREYAHEQLTATGEDHLARRSQAMDMVAFADQAEEKSRTPEAGIWFGRIKDEIPNIQAAMKWANANHHESFTLEILGNVWPSLMDLGYAAEFLSYAPELDDLDIDKTILGKGLAGIGNMQTILYRQGAARESFLKALSYGKEAGSLPIQITALMGLGYVELDGDKTEVAERYFLDVIELGETDGNPRAQFLGTASLGTLYAQRAETDKAVLMLRRSMAIAAEEGDLPSQTAIAGNLGVALQYANRLDESDTCLWTTLEYAGQIGAKETEARVWINLATNQLLMKNYDKVREYAAKGMDIGREAGILQAEVHGLLPLMAVDVAEQSWGNAVQKILTCYRYMEPDSTGRVHLQLAGTLADVLYGTNRHTQAAELTGAIRAIREGLDIPATFWLEEAECRLIEQLDATHDHTVAEAMEVGSRFDLAALVERTRQLAEEVVEANPPSEAMVLSEPEQKPGYNLTPREIEVLEMLVKGLSNPEIADELFVSRRTVTTHLTNIFTKMDVDNRTRAITEALRAGLVQA